MKRRVLALAGLMQAVKAVQHVAEQGSGDAPGQDAVLASVFRLDAEDVESVYGSVARLEPGLRALVAQIESGSGRDSASSRIAVTVLHVERRLSGNRAMLQQIRDGIHAAERQREHYGVSHPSVIAALASVYAATVSQLTPRVMVQGNPIQLSQSAVVDQIRALLLAAMRSAVLWRQLHGGYWDLLMRRRAMLDAARGWLAQLER
jgi:high frequency lysogenization protein